MESQKYLKDNEIENVHNCLEMKENDKFVQKIGENEVLGRHFAWSKRARNTKSNWQVKTVNNIKGSQRKWMLHDIVSVGKDASIISTMSFLVTHKDQKGADLTV